MGCEGLSNLQYLVIHRLDQLSLPFPALLPRKGCKRQLQLLPEEQELNMLPAPGPELGDVLRGEIGSHRNDSSRKWHSRLILL
jgi:hypothetical protein